MTNEGNKYIPLFVQGNVHTHVAKKSAPILGMVQFLKSLMVYCFIHNDTPPIHFQCFIFHGSLVGTKLCICQHLTRIEILTNSVSSVYTQGTTELFHTLN